MKGVFENNDLRIVAKHVHGFRGFVPMFHAHMEIVYVIRGSISVQIDGYRHILQPGQMSVCCPYLIHSYEESGDAEAIILLFSPAVLQQYTSNLLQYKLKIPVITNATDYLPLLRRLAALASENKQSAEMLIGSYIAVLVGELLYSQELSIVESTDMMVVQELLLYCSEHYLEDLSIRSVAESLHISESCVTKTFSGKLHCSFRDYINSLRLADAKQLLRNSDRKIIDIMYACGFRNQSRFNELFYKDMGMTPRAYRLRERS